MALTPFSTLTAALQPDGDHHTIRLPDDWLQGRTAYGGLSAALCLESIQRSVSDLPPLRSAQCCFVGPATGALSVSPSVLRRGKSAVLIACDLAGDSGLALRSTFCFGAARPSAHDHRDWPMPQVAAPEQCPNYYVWPDQPNFMDHFDGRLAAGSMPRTPAASPQMTVWLRHQDAAPESSVVRLLALADALPPAALVLADKPTPISTMTWSIDLLEPQPSTDSGWWLVQAIADTSREGYSTQSTTIWSPDGKPVLIARQNIAIFG